MKTIITFTFILAAAFLNAQTQEWVSLFNGTANVSDEAGAIISDGLGNVIVTGRVVSTGINHNFCTVKYNTGGVQQWATVYNGPSNDYDKAIGLVSDVSGNIYVTGMVFNTSAGYDIALVKYSPSGAEQWVRMWNNTSGMNDVPEAIDIDASGNIYISGTTDISGFNTNYITLKYNSSGDLQWAREYNNPINGTDAAYYVDSDNSGNVYVTGTSDAQNSGSDYFTIKYNASGDTVWTRRYSGTIASNEIPQGFAVDASGNVYVTGFSTGTGTGVDFVTIKYSSSGAQQWLVRYDSTSGQDIPEDLEVDNAGNVYVTGRTRINSSYNDFATIKYSSSGVRQWLAIYDNAPESRDDYGYDLEIDGSGNVYVTGNSQTSGTDRDALTIKYNSSGVQQWAARYDVTNSEETFDLALDESNNVYVTGYQTGTSGSDYLTIKYSQSVGIHQVSNQVPEKFVLEQNYPNPFNPETKIRYSVLSGERGSSSKIKLTVYDLLGSKVITLVDEVQSAGIYEVNFDASGLTSGIYIYKIETGDLTDMKKMTFIK